MDQKRNYHVTFKLTDESKICTTETDLEQAKLHLEQIVKGYTLRSKSFYEFVMPNGITIGIEREEDRLKKDLTPISIFEKDTMPIVHDIRRLSAEELADIGYPNYESFVKGYIAIKDFQAYLYIVSLIFQEDENVLVKDLHEKIKQYILSRPQSVYLIDVNEYRSYK